VTGGRGWTAIVTDHPELGGLRTPAYTRQAYGLAWIEFSKHPLLLLQGLADGLTKWRTTLLATAPFWAVASLEWVFLPAGLVALILRRRDARAQLLAALFAGEALSAPWIFADGGQRVFAATVGADIVIATLGLRLLVRGVTTLLDPQAAAAPMRPLGFATGPAATLAMLILLVSAPILHLPALLVPAASIPPNCSPGQYGYRFDVDRGFVLQKTPAGGRFEALVAAPDDRLAAQAGLGRTWWNGIFPDPWPNGAAIMLFSAVDQGARSPYVVALIWLDAPALHRGDQMELCADAAAARPNAVLSTLTPVASGRVLPSP
jgi:hypothetical protein